MLDNIQPLHVKLGGIRGDVRFVSIKHANLEVSRFAFHHHAHCAMRVPKLTI